MSTKTIKAANRRRLITRNPLPTSPGVYIIDRPHHHEYDRWWVGSAIFELSRTGYWTVERTPLTADEVETIRHGQTLIELRPVSEGDL
jgi:hypothetical protein